MSKNTNDKKTKQPKEMTTTPKIIKEEVEGTLADTLKPSQEVDETIDYRVKTIEDIVKQAFPEKVMKEISSDHHKTRDGVMMLTYNHFSGEWTFEHPGYIREVEPTTDTDIFFAARKFLERMQGENRKVLYGRYERLINEKLPDFLSVELFEDSIHYLDAHGVPVSMSSCKWKEYSFDKLYDLIVEKFEGFGAKGV